MIRALSLAFVVLSLLAPASAAAAGPDPRWGAVNAYEAGERANELGVSWSRLMFRWDRVQRGGPDEWWPAVTEDVINGELKRGRELVGVLINTPDWAATDRTHAFTSPPVGLDLPVEDPRNRWAEYVRRTASAYRGRVDTWIVWNEPDVWDPHHPGYTWSGSVEEFYRLQKVAYLAAHRGNPEAKVLLPGLTYFWDKRGNRAPYIARLLDAAEHDPEARAGGFFFDAAVLQLYNDPQLLYDAPTEYRRIMQSHGIDKPIWINETNVAPWDDYDRPLTRGHYRADGPEQASFFIQAYALALAAGVERLEVYKMADEPAWQFGWESYGLVRADGSVRPAFKALQMVHTLYAGARGGAVAALDGVEAVTLRRPGERLVVLWARGPRPATVRLRAIAPTAMVYARDGTSRPFNATDGAYRLDLGAATHDTAPGGAYEVGGPPLIVVEKGEPVDAAVDVLSVGDPPVLARAGPLADALAAIRAALHAPVLAQPGPG